MGTTSDTWEVHRLPSADIIRELVRRCYKGFTDVAAFAGSACVTLWGLGRSGGTRVGCARRTQESGGRPTLLVVPDGCLHEFPFDLMLSRDSDLDCSNVGPHGKMEMVHAGVTREVGLEEVADSTWRPVSDGWGTLAFFLEEFSILYGPSMTAVSRIREHNVFDADGAECMFVGMAPVRFVGRPILIETEREVRAIQALFPSSSTRVYVGADATRRVAESLPKVDLCISRRTVALIPVSRSSVD